jgi:hypothetical protein
VVAKPFADLVHTTAPENKKTVTPKMSTKKIKNTKNEKKITSDTSGCPDMMKYDSSYYA